MHRLISDSPSRTITFSRYLIEKTKEFPSTDITTFISLSNFICLSFSCREMQCLKLQMTRRRLQLEETTNFYWPVDFLLKKSPHSAPCRRFFGPCPGLAERTPIEDGIRLVVHFLMLTRLRQAIANGHGKPHCEAIAMEKLAMGKTGTHDL